jgi:hypothetical protein
MPNWCNNGLVLTHKDPAMIDRVVKSANEGILNEFIPCPQELVDTVAGSMPQGPERDAHQAQMARNIEKFGHKDWYDWNIANWGTKWDISADTCDRVDANTVRLSFDSAWSPPLGAYAKLEGQGFKVQAFYYEPGMCFAGIYENGEDDYVEFASATSETVREVVGERLDDYFGISESMAEWETEE